jgi:hypothetical protein
MDSNGWPSACSNAADYSGLNDAQLRSAIRFAEKHLRCVEEDHVELLRAYRDEIAAMRRHLVDRVLRRMVNLERLSKEQRRTLHRAFDRRRMHAEDIAATIRLATNDRTDRLDALTQIEGTALLLRLEREE